MLAKGFGRGIHSSDLAGSMQNDDYAVSVSSGDEVPPPPQTKPTEEAGRIRAVLGQESLCQIVLGFRRNSGTRLGACTED